MRVTWKLLLCAVTMSTSGCAKSLSTEPARTGSDPASARVAGDNPGGASTRPFEARLRLVGTIVTLDGWRPRVNRNQVFEVAEVPEVSIGVPPRDTVPAYSTVRQIQWRPSTALASRLDPNPIEPTDSVSHGTVFGPGPKLFRLRAPDHAGGGTALFHFMVGFNPVAWWAGPDPDRWPASTDGDGRAVDVIDWSRFLTVPAWPPDGRPYFGPDSFQYLPSVRRPPNDDFERRTFYEIYGDRIYARSEGDTVHLESWVVFCNGGYDKDSPYTPLVDPTDPGLPADFASAPERYPVLRPQGLVGSPVGFRFQVPTRLGNGMVIEPATSGLYPVFDPSSPFRSPVLAGYWRPSFPGQAYVITTAVDADGLSDRLSGRAAVRIVDVVDGGGGTPAERLQRRRILTFHVRASETPALARLAKPSSP